MYKPYLILILTTLSFSVVLSQNITPDYRNQLKFSGLRPINFFNPGIEISYERLTDNKLSTQLSVGWATNVLGKPYERLRGYNIGLEEKRFLSQKNNSAKYISLWLNNGNIRYREKTYGDGIDPITSLRIVDTFTIVKKTTSLAFKYGIQYYDNRFVLDINFGIGLKYIAVKHHDRIYKYYGPREFTDFFRAANVEKKGIVVQVPINIQLGYRF